MAKLTIKEVERRVMEAMGSVAQPTLAGQPSSLQQLLQRSQQIKQEPIK